MIDENMNDKDEAPVYEVFFSDGYNLEDLPESNWILIVPLKDSWNDFGHRCRCHFYIRNKNDSEEYEDATLLGFLPAKENNLNPYHEEIYSAFSFPKTCRQDQLPEFFTLLTGMEAYRRLVGKFGIDGAKNILSALNDLVFLKKSGLKPEILKEALKTEVFKLAFMRNNDNFFAFHNAEGILNGLSEEQVSVVSQLYTLKLLLPGSDVENRIELNFDLESFLPKRINVLIGPNGLGKSRSLNAIAESLIKADEKLTSSDHGRVMVNRLIALATPGETLNTFPPENEKSHIQYRRLAISRAGQKVSSRGFGELCVQLARSIESIAGKSRWEIFKECLNAIKGAENIVLEIESPNTVQHSEIIISRSKKYVPLKRLSIGGEQATLELWAAVKDIAGAYRYIEGKVVPLSSGEQAFLKFAAQACLFVENGTMLLLDEPETHLHPNLISDFIEVLDSLLEKTGSIAILATHSAYFVREVPKSQVLVFKSLLDNAVEVVNPRLNTFGADIGAISYFVFDDDITSVLVRKLESRFKSRDDLKKYLDSEESKELSADIIMHLKKKFGEGF
ncbi:hypothetical protein A3197_17260 [Candidatus Thiodiazotropha endoloripes]|nr:hypothetical protein A3197_17260 [Candidatus Thiodiazotropha endoloripes]